MSRQTFNYQQHNVCGGPSHRTVTQGPKRSICVGTEWVNLQPPVAKLPKPIPPEGKYVTRTTGKISAVAFRANVQWLKALRAKQAVQVTESTEEWLRKHKIGVYAPQGA